MRRFHEVEGLQERSGGWAIGHPVFAMLEDAARLKNFLVGWLLVLGLKEGLVEWATVNVKSWVILK